jgi:hypothetical protein
MKTMTHISNIRANLLFAFILMLIQSFACVVFTPAAQAQQHQNTVVMPQGQEATYVPGVNVAGTVRVNNLANLEALLNIIANGAEMLGLLFGLALIIRSLLSGRPDLVIPLLKWKLNRRVQFAIGSGLILLGLILPGTINWLVAASNPDANLFS